MATYHRLNGAIYIREIKYLDNEISVCDNNEYAYVMSRTQGIDIDTQEDFDLAEFYIKYLESSK